MCKHIFKNGTVCGRNPRLNEYCGFHAPENHEDRYNDTRFLKNLKVLLKNEDGDWRGFKFPSHIDASDVNIDVQLNVSEAVFDNVRLNQVEFRKKIHALNLLVRGRLDLSSVTFSADLRLEGSIFSGECQLRFLIVEGKLALSESIFQNDFILSGRLRHSNFNGCNFQGAAKFKKDHKFTGEGSGTLGPVNIQAFGEISNPNFPFFVRLKIHVMRFFLKISNLLMLAYQVIVKSAANWVSFAKTKIIKVFTQLRRRFPYDKGDKQEFILFDGEARFENVTFSTPKMVEFKGVDLRNVRFSGTDLRDVTFIGNNWWQQKLGRDGLYEDVQSRKHSDFYTLQETMPPLENSYRNIRLSLENVKDFSGANDFFVGEMEAQRKQLPMLQRCLFSVNALYCYFSKYGTSPLRCFCWFVVLLITHSLFIVWAGDLYDLAAFKEVYNSVVHLLTRNNEASLIYVLEQFRDFMGWAVRICTYSLQTLTLQKDKLALIGAPSTGVYLINSVFSILGPITAGLFALTVRARIKRH